mgnify:CR=1 FL=1
MAKAKASKPKKAKAEVAETSQAESKFTILDNVPIPPRARGGNGGQSQYPFAQLGVGQSFILAHEVDEELYPDETERKAAIVEESQKLANRLSGATRRFTKNNEGFKFTVRTVPEGVQVWRIEE